MRIARRYRSRLVHHVTTCIYSLWERGFWLYELFLREFQVISEVAETLLFSFSYLRSCLLLTVLLLSIPLFLFLCQYHWPTESLIEQYWGTPQTPAGRLCPLHPPKNLPLRGLGMGRP